MIHLAEAQATGCPRPAGGTDNSKRPLISVIVPVFNVERYLPACLDSIIAQSYADLEILVIDDGSTDASGRICDEYASEDERVEVVHQANGGLSEARNTGLGMARGAYVSFIDSDDFVSPVFIEALFVALTSLGCKMAVVPHGCGFRDGEDVRLEESLALMKRPGAIEALDRCRCQELMLYQVLDTGAPWRLCERSLLGHEPFPEGMYYEDLASVYKLVERTGEIALVNCCNLYAYRLRPNSILGQRYTRLKAESGIEASQRLYADMRAWHPDLEKAAASRCFSVNRMVFAQIPGEEKSDRALVWGELAKYRLSVLKDPKARKRERLAAGIACLGKVPFALFCRACRKLGLLR